MDFTNNNVSEKTKLRIIEQCNRYRIFKYTINDDASIDVDGSVYCRNNKLSKLPLSFRKIKGSFDCSYNLLTTLEGCPVEVGGSFSCHHNRLTSLVGCPVKVDDFYCDRNKLTSLKHCPKEVGGNFSCSNNKLTSLRYCPDFIHDSFNCDNNEIDTLMYLPKFVNDTITDVELFNLGSTYSFINNRLPKIVMDKLLTNPDHRYDLHHKYHKYHKYYDVWQPEFNLEGFNELMSDINDGLE